MTIPPPMGLLAELTHRCPLGCPYCSNPLALTGPEHELDARTWKRVFREAADLGVLQVHLSGGEPAMRRDLVDIVASAREAGLYTNLITSGVGLTDRMRALSESGLDHVQVSIQDSREASCDSIADYPGAFRKKEAVAALTRTLKIPLTVNAVLHRANIERMPELVALACEMGAQRIEIAHVQYYGWALRNRAALMPTREQAQRAVGLLGELRSAYEGRLVIDSVIPDYYARYPKPCLGGWGRRSINVAPDGLALPCHAAQVIPGLRFWSVRDRSLAEIWRDSPAFNAFRGFDWMQEPCRSCARREIDFGGCRCQALILTGDARAADPVCHLSPRHADVARIAARREDRAFVFRRFRTPETSARQSARRNCNPS